MRDWMRRVGALAGSVFIFAACGGGPGPGDGGTTGQDAAVADAGGDAGSSDAGPSAGGCDATTPRCLHAEGMHAGAAFNFTCTGGETGYSPVVVDSPILPDDLAYQAVCGDGVMNGSLGDTYSVQLLAAASVVADLKPGTYTYDTPGTNQANGVELTLQVTKTPANQLQLQSPNFQLATLTITEHTPRSLVAGTFTGQWSSSPTVDLHSGSWKHLCGMWTGTGCNTGLGQPVPSSCTCSQPPMTTAGNVSGSFRFAFP